VLGDAYTMLEQFDSARVAYERALAEQGQGATIDRSFVQLKLLDLPIQTAEEEPGTDDEAAADEDAG
jgi:hypothetical protein